MAIIEKERKRSKMQTMQRFQMPFAMTINTSQGKSILKNGLYLPRPVFTHRQLYVALSRVKSKNGLIEIP